MVEVRADGSDEGWMRATTHDYQPVAVQTFGHGCKLPCAMTCARDRGTRARRPGAAERRSRRQRVLNRRGDAEKRVERGARHAVAKSQPPEFSVTPTFPQHVGLASLM